MILETEADAQCSTLKFLLCDLMGTSGPKQHIVPQMMIRRFTNEKGKLYEFYKPKLTIATKMRSPSGVLFRDNYYKDKIADFDEEILQPVEQKFAFHYAEIVDKPWQNRIWPGGIGAAFIDWVVAQFCRTGLLVEMTKAIVGDIPGPYATAYSRDSKLGNNLVRQHMFSKYQDFLSRPLWKWKCLDIRANSNLVITDNPVCYALGHKPGLRTLLVPLSSKRILFGGLAEAAERCRELSVREINFSLAAWAERHVFAADKQTLTDIRTDLRGEGIILGPQEVLDAARKSLFGLPERVRTNPVPANIDIDSFWKSLKDSHGPAIVNSEDENSH